MGRRDLLPVPHCPVLLGSVIPGVPGVPSCVRHCGSVPGLLGVSGTPGTGTELPG